MVKVSVACVQINSTPDLERNLAGIERQTRQAAAAGAQLVALPEACEFLDEDPAAFPAHARCTGTQALDRLRALAEELQVWLLAGSLSVQNGSKIANRSYLIDDGGEIVCHYDKIHLFDVTLANGEEYRESAIYASGSSAVLASTPWGPAGLSICYDLRFPGLYRRLAQAGARLIFIPAAFTRTTGELHWHALLRARAIETGSFIIAPAQCGIHAGSRASFGHSLIVDPWGRVLADGGTEPGNVHATLELDEVERFRAAIPSPLVERSYELARAGHE